MDIFEKTKRKKIIKHVEKALNISLYDWQKEFIFNDNHYMIDIPKGRTTGKTTAHILYLCLSKGELINLKGLNQADYFSTLAPYVGEDGKNSYRLHCFVQELKKIYKKLYHYGKLELRKIIF